MSLSGKTDGISHEGNKNQFSFHFLFTHSFIPDIYIAPCAPTRNLLRGALSPAAAKEKCLKKLAERRHIDPGAESAMDSYCMPV